MVVTWPARSAARPMPRLVMAIQASADCFLRACRAACGPALRARTQPSKDALLLLARREVLMHDRQNLRRLHKHASICDAELRVITHRLLGAK